jgi:hypothetical protein
MTIAATDTFDIKCAWLASLENMDISLSRLKKDAPTLCLSETAASSKSNIDSMSMAKKSIEELGLKLMDTWGISRTTLLKWMDLDPDAYAKHISYNGFIVSHSSNSQSGRIRKSRRK